jgi:hypothetical protein
VVVLTDVPEVLLLAVTGIAQEAVRDLIDYGAAAAPAIIAEHVFIPTVPSAAVIV